MREPARREATMIEVQHVAKSFGRVEAVRDVSFCARDGAITGLLGANGAGKTTTLRMICTLISPERGKAMVDGYDCAGESRRVRTILGALPDARGLYPRLTAREHLAYFGGLHGLVGKALERRIDELVEQLDMRAIADRRTEGFSAGQRLKVALARALLHDPQNVILDEPTSGLDIMSTRALRAVIRGLRDRGRAVLLSTHVMQEVAALCDEIVVLARGCVVSRGTPEGMLAAAGTTTLEDAFVAALGSDEGVLP